MKLPDVEEAFRSRARIVGGVVLLKPADAIELVASCKEKGIAVFGAEGFYIIGDKIQPSMAHSFSLSDSVQDCHETTIAFLESHRRGDLWFEVMIDAARQQNDDDRA